MAVSFVQNNVLSSSVAIDSYARKYIDISVYFAYKLFAGQ